MSEEFDRKHVPDEYKNVISYLEWRKLNQGKQTDKCPPPNGTIDSPND